MKLKKILASFIASAAIVSSASLNALAIGDGEATYCFDNANRIADWETYGSAAETGLTFTPVSGVSQNGNGSLLVSENVTGEIESTFGGAFISADKIGLENFEGCTITMSVLLCEGAENAVDQFSLYSDGIIWVQSKPIGINTTTWTDVSLILPENTDNTKIGFTIPTYSQYSGDILYIDDLTVTRADGTVIANVGDHQQKTMTAENTVSTGTNIALTILLVVLILAIVGGIGLIVSAIVKKFA